MTSLGEQGRHDGPVVSIGLPVFNGEPFLRRALESLRAQRFGDYEVVASDNASSDGTWRILEECAREDARISLYRQPVNIGMNRNFEFVLRHARAPFFCWMASDDSWEPGFLERCLGALERHLAHGVAMTSLVRVSENGVPMGEIAYTGSHDPTELDHVDTARRMLKLVPGPGLHYFIYGLFRTPLLRRVLSKPFPSCIGADRVVMCEVALATRLCALPDLLHRKTIRTQSLTDRYGTEEVGRSWHERRRILRQVMTLAHRVLASRCIPLATKVRALPLLGALVWRRRRQLAGELLHPW